MFGIGGREMPSGFRRRKGLSKHSRWSSFCASARMFISHMNFLKNGLYFLHGKTTSDKYKKQDITIKEDEEEACGQVRNAREEGGKEGKNQRQGQEPINPDCSLNYQQSKKIPREMRGIFLSASSERTEMLTPEAHLQLQEQLHLQPELPLERQLLLLQ